MSLPKGYLDMTRDDYDSLSVEVLSEVYHTLRDIARYTMGIEAVGHATLRNSPNTPVDWIMAVREVTCKCDKCKGTGIYKWGSSVNSKMTYSGGCFRCSGNGQMDFDDMRRCKAYDNHAIIAACRS